MKVILEHLTKRYPSRDKNGTTVTAVNDFNFAATSPIAQDGFQVGRVGAASYTTFQDIYRAAVYSRALTADEIAANYAIDKARFGLP